MPESIPADALNQFLTDFMAIVLPHLSTLDLTIDRIHRIPKSLNLAQQAHRNTIAGVHFYHVKKRIPTCFEGTARGPRKI